MSYFLFECCRPIKGYSRSIIYDLERTDYDFVPNELWQHITTNKVNIKYIPQSYLDFLLSKEYIYLMDNLSFQKGFTPLNLDWCSPSIIENTIIKLTTCKNLDFQKIIYVLEQLNCFHVQINISELIRIEELENLMFFFNDTKINTVELILKYNNFTINSLQLICEKYLRIKSVIIYSSPFKQIKNDSDDTLGNIVFLKTSMKELLSSGIRIYHFVTNFKLFTESQAHHTYFNRKLYIGPKGEIKNAPECEETFGNINDIKNTQELKQIIAKSEFQKYWYIHKELCDVCKDCEFRHMCVDSRLPFQREDDSWYHKTECNYNPYICKWEGEEGYQTLEECGVISDEKGISIDHERIAAINKILWEEET